MICSHNKLHWSTMLSVSLSPDQQIRRERNTFATRGGFGPMLVLFFLFSLTQIAAKGQTDSNTPVVAQHVPAWMDQAIFYEVFPRDFSPAGDLNGRDGQA